MQHCDDKPSFTKESIRKFLEICEYNTPAEQKYRVKKDRKTAVVWVEDIEYSVRTLEFVDTNEAVIDDGESFHLIHISEISALELYYAPGE